MVEEVLSKVFWAVSATVFAAATVGYAQQVPCYFIFGDSVFDSGNNNNLQTKAKVNFLPYGELSGFKDFIPPFAGTSPERAHIGMNYASGAGGLREETSEHLVRRFKVRHKACCTLSPGEELCTPNKPVCANRSEYVFWDDIHSSEATNMMMARSSFDGPLGEFGLKRSKQYYNADLFSRVKTTKTRPSRSIAGIVVRCSKSEESGLGFARLEGESWKMHGSNLRCLQLVLCFYKKRTTVSIWDKLLQTNH
ncbi:hypothetical protein Bca52824_016700 [Brassica carinata]|uniref:GDSL esterase/lipase n=1 Tax=Brassica carinata TaxID=52824 RepID=A0A8X8B6X5_BRACI|nr:hypothetical protein Bca52824_016700 [Brassica carinata]